MANYNFSQLPAATTIVGSEIIPVMQGGVTKHVPISDIPIDTMIGYDSLVTQTQLADISGTLVTQTQLADISGTLVTQTQLAGISGTLVTQTQLASVSGSLVTQTQLASVSGSLVTQTQLASVSGSLVTQTQLAGISGTLLVKTNNLSDVSDINTARSNLGFGTPDPYSANQVLSLEDNGKTLIVTLTPVLTINTGLPVGFGCSIKGAFTYNGTATITDVRISGASNPWCALVNTGTNTYDLVGTK